MELTLAKILLANEKKTQFHVKRMSPKHYIKHLKQQKMNF